MKLKRLRHIALIRGSALSMLAVTAVGYSAWASLVETTQNIATVTSIPAVSNFAVTTSGSNYVLTWTVPTATDYNGNQLALEYEVQASSTGASGSWTTIKTLPGSTNTYTTAATTSDAYFRIVTVNHNWLSTYSSSGSGGGTTTSPPATISYQVYNPPPNYCIDPNTATAAYSFSSINPNLVNNYICSLPTNAGLLATTNAVSSSSNPYASIVISTQQPIDSAFDNGSATTTTDMAPNSTSSDPLPYYGLIGLTSPSAFYDLYGASPYEALYYATGGVMYGPVPYYCNPAVGTGPGCPNRVAYWTQDKNAIPPPSAYTSIPFQLGNSIFNNYNLYYKPSCAVYPSSASASNFSSYVASCVTPYDSSYQEYTTVTTTIN